MRGPDSHNWATWPLPKNLALLDKLAEDYWEQASYLCDGPRNDGRPEEQWVTRDISTMTKEEQQEIKDQLSPNPSPETILRAKSARH
jgi:hypothetical protein